MKTKLYCNFCGKTLDTDLLEGKKRQACRSCEQVYYENPLPVASVIVSNREREVLLVQRGRAPFQGMWCFPIGFAETGESIENAALRELKEEAGIEGKIIQLVDVASHVNPVYGELIVVTFEAEKTGGTERAGDDAQRYGYFPISNLPKLAFDAQEKALHKYKELKKDLWSIHDSFDTFVEGAMGGKATPPGKLLSDELARAVEGKLEKIIGLWIDDITTNPSTASYHRFDREELFGKALFIIEHLGSWLKGERSEEELRLFYCDLGRQRKEEGVLLEDLVSSLSLLKKHTWLLAYSSKEWEKAVDIYQMFELGERMVRFFDRATYYTVTGYSRGRICANA